MRRLGRLLIAALALTSCRRSVNSEATPPSSAAGSATIAAASASAAVSAAAPSSAPPAGSATPGASLPPLIGVAWIEHLELSDGGASLGIFEPIPSYFTASAEASSVGAGNPR